MVKVSLGTPLRPPILQTRAHSSAVTGCTDSREYLTSAMSLSFGSALTAASVTGFGTGFTRLHVDRHEHALLVGRVRIGFLDDLDDADDLLLVAGVIEEGEIALLHLLQVPRAP